MPRGVKKMSVIIQSFFSPKNSMQYGCETSFPKFLQKSMSTKIDVAPVVYRTVQWCKIAIWKHLNSGKSNIGNVWGNFDFQKQHQVWAFPIF